MRRDHLLYCLVTRGGRRSYVGVTADLKRRLRQHRGEISGGARSTRGYRESVWEVGYVIHGLPSRRVALQWEWRLHRGPRRPRHVEALEHRLTTLARALARERMTEEAPRTSRLLPRLSLAVRDLAGVAGRRDLPVLLRPL